MKNLIDAHTHTAISGHALSSLKENAQVAAEKGMEGIIETEHSFLIEGAAPGYFFKVPEVVPDELCGVRVYFGAEVNIWGFSGEVDVVADYLKKLDYVIASLHEVVMCPGSVYDNTRAAINAIRNPLIDCIGHCENLRYPVDIEALACAAKEYNKILEINTGSLNLGRTSPERLLELMELCAKHGVRVSMGSDAHMCEIVGSFDRGLQLMEQIGFPEELLITRDKKTLDAYIEERQKRVYEFVQSGVIQF